MRRLSSGIRLTLGGAALAALCACAVDVKAPRSAPESPARVSTLAGSGQRGSSDGDGKAASFNNPSRVAVDATGHVYVADTEDHRVRRITPAGVVSTLAGTGARGSRNGPGVDASFDRPSGLAVDAIGNVYVADASNHRIRKITPEGIVSTLAGSGERGSSDGEGANASFNFPNGVALDTSGNVYVTDLSNHRIRKISPVGIVSTLAGSGAYDFSDGPGAQASFKRPFGLAVDASGHVYVADAGNNRIRKITPTGVVSTLAGSGKGRFSDGIGTGASFRFPYGVAVDASGHVYVADTSNRRIRKITP